MTSIVIIQARSSSSRLPGKALLHFRGFPLVVLAAKRAASTGRTVLLATSNHLSDDALATVAARYGIACHRGPLDNVLGRFTQALQGYSDDTSVIRLTAHRGGRVGHVDPDPSMMGLGVNVQHRALGSEPSMDLLQGVNDTLDGDSS